MTAYLQLADWRRRVAEIYSDVRRQRGNPAGAWHKWRQKRDDLFANHPQSPLEQEDSRRSCGLPFHDYDPAFRFLVEIVASDAPKLVLDAGADGTVAAEALGRTSGLANALGGELTLYWIGGYGGGIFLPFQDATSGQQSYGGGRYLLDGIKGADLGQDQTGRLILDFNFAYHPSCCYSPQWICPLSPATNRLPGSVTAGEMLP